MRNRQPRIPRQWPAEKPKPSLPMVQIASFLRVRYYDLETYLTKVYHMVDFDFFQAAPTIAPGLCPEYLVQAAVPPEPARRIRSGYRTRDINLILNTLCIDGFIPAGHYIIDTHKPPDPINIYKAILRKTLNPLHPDCIRHKNHHRHDREFRRMAARIDQSLDKFLQENGNE